MTTDVHAPRANRPVDLLKVPEVADLLRVSTKTIYRLVEGRILPFYRLRGQLLFLRSELEEYLRSVRVASIDE